MDFLKQTNFRYIVIIIIIILAVINLCKINSQENFMDLDEDQNLGSHKVTMNDTDQVMFGDKTLTHKLTNIESGRLVLGNDPNGSQSNLEGRNGLHLKSNRDVFLMSPSSNATIVSTNGGNSGKLVVEGRADFKSGAFIEGEFHSTNNTPEGGRISLMNSSKTAIGEIANWTIYNMTGDYSPNGLHFWKYPNNPNNEQNITFGSTFILTDNGDTHVKGNFLAEGDLTVNGDTRIYGAMEVYGTAQFLGILHIGEGLSVGEEVGIGGGLAVNGDIRHGGTITNVSDRRLKENIKNISQNDKDKVLQLVPKTYNMISDQNKKRYGLIAQEVEELYPELVNTNETDGMKSLNYIELIPLLLEQIKELKKSVPNQNIINIDGVTLNKNELSKLKQLINM